MNYINQAIDPLSKTLEVEILINDSDPDLKSGMFGEFSIEIQKKENTIVIPENALLSRTEVLTNRETGLQNSVKKYFVFVIQEGKAYLKEVQTGLGSDGRIEITGGLRSGDSVIIVGQNIVKEGNKVNIID